MSINDGFEKQIVLMKRQKRTKVHVPLPPYYINIYNTNQSQEQQEQAEIVAKCTLEAYTEELISRFKDGGNHDTYMIPSGETFVEIVCGGYWYERASVRCYEPLTAVQLFIDAMERYFVTKPNGQTLHWRTRPAWAQRFDEPMQDVLFPEKIYSIYARLVLV